MVWVSFCVVTGVKLRCAFTAAAAAAAGRREKGKKLHIMPWRTVKPNGS
jgi:hypothetical protein